MTDLRKAAKMALDFIGRLKFADAEPEPDLVMKALRQALAQPEQEPVAWIGNADFVKGQFVEGRVRRVWWECNTGVGQPLYTAPPKREWQELTDEDWHNLPTSNKQGCERDAEIFNWIEEKLKEKNT